MTLEELYTIFKASSGAVTDSRLINTGCLFFALKGEKFDANTFAAEALEKGASYAIIDNPKLAVNNRYIVTDNVLETLQDLAHFHRTHFNIPVIGLTGSNGKTTNKELLSRVLSRKYKVHATQGNLNNHIGVPLTLLSMPLDTEIAVIEMGANHQKEIKMLSEIAAPTHGFITNLGRAHLEGFGGEEGVKKGKGELMDYLKDSGGIAFVNTTNLPVFQLVQEKRLMTTVFYGADERSLELITDTPLVEFFAPDSRKKYITHLSGKYNFDNMQTAYNVGRFFNVSETEACMAIASYTPDNNRSQIVEVDSNTFFMDAYNANPSSMEAALRNFAGLKTEKQKVVVLGDMFELGEYSELEHSTIGRLVHSLNFTYVVLYGEAMRHALKYLPRAYYFTDKFSMHNWLLDMHFKNTYFLVKGSRGVGLESVLKTFLAIGENKAPK